MNIQRLLTRVIPFLSAVLVAAACSSARATTSASSGFTSIVIRWGEGVAPTTAVGRGDLWFAQQVTAQTDGAVKFQFGWSSAFGSNTEFLPELKNGTLGLATTAASSAGPGELPYMNLLSNVGFLFDSSQEALTAGQALVTQFPEFQDEAQGAGLRLMWGYTSGTYFMIEKSPDCSLASLRGTSARSFGALASPELKAVGVNPVTLVPAEFYPALSRGLVDEIPLPADSIVGDSLQQAAHYLCTASPGASYAPEAYMSLLTWNQLSPRTQAVFKSAAEQVPGYELGQQSITERAALETMKSEDVKLLIFPAADEQTWMDKAPNEIQDWVQMMTAKGAGPSATAIATRLKSLTSGPFAVDTSLITSVYGPSS